MRFIDWLEPLLRRESYIALLVERPEVQNRLLRLLGLARWPMRYLMMPPRRDRRAGRRAAAARSRFDACRLRRRACRPGMRPGHGRARPTRSRCSTRCAGPTMRRSSASLVRDVEDHISVEEVADDLSALADATLRLCASSGAWRHLKQAHRAEPRLRGDRLRQARRQGTRLRQRPGRRLRLRRPTRRARPRCRYRHLHRGLRRLRAQADQLADACAPPPASCSTSTPRCGRTAIPGCS